ncbi:MAG TPA: hypothetical protein VLO09_04965, partial [Ornithinimicrobium sp.]|nr:hypothetical protein [Ornithinimicrobium sp.]
MTTALLAAVVTAGVRRLERNDRLPGGRARWRRTNHAGEPVSLVEGVALAGGTATALLPTQPAVAGAVVLAGLAGALDDLVGDGTARGLRGHLDALRRGRPTTGALKVLALSSAGLLAVAVHDGRTPRGRGLHTLAGAGVVAGAANLANLFDLRPGRALKVALAHALPLAVLGHPAAAAVGGAGLVALPDDLAGRTMLGDTGANPLGAAVGAAVAHRLGPGGRWASLAVLTGLTLLSERV